MGGMVDVGEVAARDVEVLAAHLGEFMKPYLKVVGWSSREKQLGAFVAGLLGQHLHRLLDSFIAYYNGDRTHLAVGRDSPFGRPVEQRPVGATSSVVSFPRVGGLHHRYAWRQAA